MRLILLAILMIKNFYSYSQTFNKEEKFIAICKSIASIEDIRDSIFLCNYENKRTLFILSKTEYINDFNKKIDIDIDSIRLSIWFKKDLFFRNIPYWFELSEIYEKSKNKIIVKFRSYNSVNVLNKKPIIKGEVILKFQNGTYRILNKRITIRWPEE